MVYQARIIHSRWQKPSAAAAAVERSTCRMGLPLAAASGLLGCDAIGSSRQAHRLRAYHHHPPRSLPSSSARSKTIAAQSRRLSCLDVARSPQTANAGGYRPRRGLLPVRNALPARQVNRSGGSNPGDVHLQLLELRHWRTNPQEGLLFIRPATCPAGQVRSECGSIPWDVSKQLLDPPHSSRDHVAERLA